MGRTTKPPPRPGQPTRYRQRIAQAGALLALTAALAACSAEADGAAREGAGDKQGSASGSSSSRSYDDLDACRLLASVDEVAERFPIQDDRNPRLDSETERYDGTGEDNDHSTQSCEVSAVAYADGLASPDGALDVSLTIRGEGGAGTLGGDIAEEHERRGCQVAFIGSWEAYIRCDDADWDARIYAKGSGQFALDGGGWLSTEADAYVRWLADAVVDAL